jgi:hypothetical protein
MDDREQFEAELAAELEAEQGEAEPEEPLDLSEDDADEGLDDPLLDDEPESAEQPLDAPQRRRQPAPGATEELRRLKEQRAREAQQRQIQDAMASLPQRVEQELSQFLGLGYEQQRGFLMQLYQRQILVQHLEAADRADKTAFYQRRKLTPGATKELEDTLIAARNRGGNPTREDAYEWLLFQKHRRGERGGPHSNTGAETGV